MCACRENRTVSTRPPFIDPDEGSLDTSQILTEAFPLIRLITLFGGLALMYVVARGIQLAEA